VNEVHETEIVTTMGMPLVLNPIPIVTVFSPAAAYAIRRAWRLRTRTADERRWRCPRASSPVRQSVESSPLNDRASEFTQ
jgi:hypothetical protein